MIADIKGTLGWRPDILTRLETAYLHTEIYVRLSLRSAAGRNRSADLHPAR